MKNTKIWFRVVGFIELAAGILFLTALGSDIQLGFGLVLTLMGAKSLLEARLIM